MKSLDEKPKKHGSIIVRYYLVTYNVLSALGWSYVLFAAMAHLSGITDLSRVPPVSSHTATSVLTRILGSIPYIKSSIPTSAQVQSRMPSFLLPFVDRARTTFAAVGLHVAFVQSLAILEIVHSSIGWVRSPVVTTLMQVASRLFLVWGITEQYAVTWDNPLYASMVLAWSVAEVIRYSFYAANLLQLEYSWLLWLRYNTFFVLYPLGAGSEAALIFSTLPFTRTWIWWDYGRAVLFLVWWPSLYVLYTYMMKQRRRVRGERVNPLESKRRKIS